MRTAAQILGEGRLTVPATVREELGLERGDFVVIDIEPLDQKQHD